MTISPAGLIPEWTRGDRLRKARETTGMTTRQFAEHIGVSQKTVTDAENDKRPNLRKILLNAWALGTGVPPEWLETGTVPTSGPDGGGEGSSRFTQWSPDSPRDLGPNRAGTLVAISPWTNQEAA